MIDDLFAADTEAAARDRIAKPLPPKPVEPKFSAWKALTAPVRGATEGMAQRLGGVAEVLGGFGQVLGAYPEAAGYNPTGEARKQSDEQRQRLLSEGVDMSNDVGDALRAGGRAYRSDPATAHEAEQIIYGLARGAFKVVGDVLTVGPFAPAVTALDEGLSAADDLRLQGVDVATRTKAGAAQGAGMALYGLPIVGQTKLATAGLYAIGGPGGFMAQQALTREILQGAGYDKIGAQFDPFDPVGLAVATLLPAGFAAHGLRQQKLQRAVDSLPDLPPRADAVPPADPAAPAPFPSRPSAIADAVRAYPTEAVDAARVVLLAERRAAANPGAADNLRAMDQHEAALSRAEDQLAAGERVQVADVAPAIEPTGAVADAPMANGTYGDGGAWSAVFRAVDRTDGTVALVRDLTDDTGTTTQHLQQDGTWANGEPPRTALTLGAGMRQVDGPEAFPNAAAAMSHAVDVEGARRSGAPLFQTWSEQITNAARDLQTTPSDAPAQRAPAAPPAAVDTRPTITNKAGQVFIDTRGTGERLHGTGQPIGALSNDYALNGDARNIYGQGFYTTDAADIAAGYMRKGGRNAALYTVTVRDGVKLYDMEQPMSPEVAQIARDNMGEDYFPTENAETGAPITTLRGVYDEYRAESRGNDVSQSEVQEVFDGIRYRLEQLGYGGFQHLGGTATKNPTHTVQIFWSPEQDVSIRQISLDQFKPDAPTTTQAANPEAAAPARGAGDAPAAAGAADAGRSAGVEAAGVTPGQAQGLTTSAVTERGLTVPLRYRLAEAGDLTTSHTNDLTAAPAFPAELQPRDRSRAASAEQISRIENAIRPELLGESVKASDGAPIVGPDAVVESGNARTIALRRAYESGKANAYRAWLADNAERFGLTRQQVEGMQQPVLVRERLGEVDRAEFARQANESAVAAMSPTEQAMSDARRITDLSGLVANEDGTINMAQSADFVRQFIGQAVAPTERGTMLQANGQLSQAGMNRLRNAVFAKAYGDADILAMLTESTDANVRNILAGMLRAAPEVAKLADLAQAGARQDADIAGPLVEAVRLFSQLRSEGRTVQQFMAQGSMFGDGLSPEIAAMLEAVSLNARAPKRIAEMIGGMVDTVNSLGDSRQMGMFGDAPTGADAVAGAAERAVMDSRMAMVADRFPDLQVQVDGMDASMPMADFMAAAKAEADELAANAPLVQVAAECALLNGF